MTTTTRCRVCYSKHHVMQGTGKICPGGFREDFTPGLHDAHTGEVKKRSETEKVGKWVDGRWVVSEDWMGGAK